MKRDAPTSDRHFQAERWVDYVRGVASGRERDAMSAHLESGCEKCRREADLMSRFATAAAASRLEAPADVAAVATALYAPPASIFRRRTTSLPLRLAFDSFRQPALTGIRGAAGRRHILYEAGGYSVDLSIAREGLRGRQRSGRIALVGQVAVGKRSDRPLRPVPVLLMSGTRITARAVTNAFGEFHFEYDPTKRCRLRIPVTEGWRIDIPLHAIVLPDGDR